jgi:hypothetical protein
MTDELSKEELLDATMYEIFRTGSKSHKHYQINKVRLGVTLDQYWVVLKAKEVQCSCPGFRIQKYPAIDHKHVKLAQDYWDRGEPEGLLYKIEGTGSQALIRPQL